MTPPETEIIPMPCRICGKAVGVVLPEEGNEHRKLLEKLALKTVVHDHCKDAAVARTKALVILAAGRKQQEDWDSICPAEFRKDLDYKKSGYNANRLEQVMKWPFGARGLLLHGPTRKCKTRFMYKLLDREFQDGRAIGAWAHADLRSRLSALAAGDSAALAKFTDHLKRLDILFVDDLGKGRRTPAAEEAFFAIVDGRVRQNLPTLYTMNGTLQEFGLQVSPEYREPLIRRIEESVQILEFR